MKILFIRRDNIGDLVCTTPAIHAARERFPNAKIGVLVNTYNADTVRNNPDIDEIYAYEKAKHVPYKSRLSVWWNNMNILYNIRRERYDVAIGCGSYSPRLARYTLFTGAPIRIGYARENSKISKAYTIPLYDSADFPHEVEKVFRLLLPLGISSPPPSLKVYPVAEEVQKVLNCLKGNKPVIAFHISSRRPENRWPAENFTELGKLLVKEYKANIVLLWSPGSEKNPFHPGDDEKAEEIVRSFPSAIIPYRTAYLGELIAALSIADLVVCGDGGAMHIAAALGKPIVTIWGSTGSDKWRPWGVIHTILQSQSRQAAAIKVGEAFGAAKELYA